MAEEELKGDQDKRAPERLGQLRQNAAVLFAIGSAFLAAALPAAEFVKGVYELRVKEREHADQVSIEFLRLITNKDTQREDRLRILNVLVSEKAESPLKSWAIDEKRHYEQEEEENEALYRRRQEAEQVDDASRRAYEVARINLEDRQAEMQRRLREGADAALLRPLAEEIHKLSETLRPLETQYTASVSAVAVVATASDTAKGHASEASGSSDVVSASVELRDPAACANFESKDFKGRAAPLTKGDFAELVTSLGVEPASFEALVEVGGGTRGFIQGRPVILFERHVFHVRTAGRFSAEHPDISSPMAGGYIGGAGEYNRLKKAMVLDCAAALNATSWGRFQILGFQHAMLGFNYVDDFVNAMMDSERAQTSAFGNFIRARPAFINAVKQKNWDRVAFFLFGKNYIEFSYSRQLDSAYNKLNEMFSGQTPPSEQTRSVQRGLATLRYFNGVQDGRTSFDLFWSIRTFQVEHGIAGDGLVGSQTQAAIEACVTATAACPRP